MWARPVTTTEELQPSLLDTIHQSQRKDAFVTNEKWKREEAAAEYVGSWKVAGDGILHFKGHAYIPDSEGLKEELLRTFHDSRAGGHLGTAKTLKRLSAGFFWPALRRDVRHYVATYVVCQRTKPRTHLPYDELASLPVPQGPFQELSLNFIVGLPNSINATSRISDSVLVIINRLTKFTIYIATISTLTTKELALLL